MRLARAYRSLPRPSSAPEPSHPPGGVVCLLLLGHRCQCTLSQTCAGPQRAIIALGLSTRDLSIASLSHKMTMKLETVNLWLQEGMGTRWWFPWTRRDLNPWPSGCKPDALPAELRARTNRRTPRVRHPPIPSPNVVNLLEGSTDLAPGWRCRAQEVIQPQLPLRLPCYDLTLLAEPGLDLTQRTRPRPDSTRVA